MGLKVYAHVTDFGEKVILVEFCRKQFFCGYFPLEESNEELL